MDLQHPLIAPPDMAYTLVIHLSQIKIYCLTIGAIEQDKKLTDIDQLCRFD